MQKALCISPLAQIFSHINVSPWEMFFSSVLGSWNRTAFFTASLGKWGQLNEIFFSLSWLIFWTLDIYNLDTYSFSFLIFFKGMSAHRTPPHTSISISTGYFFFCFGYNNYISLVYLLFFNLPAQITHTKIFVHLFTKNHYC